MSDDDELVIPITPTSPPLDAWERQGALRELARAANDLERADGASVLARMGRLTQDQRDAVAEAMERILDLGV